jgi:hypothetical protein
VKTYRESLPDALRILSMFGEAAPEPAKGQFLRALRDQGLREIYDSEAPLEYVKAWRRPDLRRRWRPSPACPRSVPRPAPLRKVSAQ